MQKFSRSLLFAGALAIGTLTACEGDTITTEPQGVQSITVTPPSATINVGESITLAASVTADAATAKTVTWSTSNTATATVDAAGKVTGVKAGNVTITATSTADPSKAAASAITVTGVGGPVPPAISISTVNAGGTGNPAILTNVNGQLDVTLNVTGGAGTVELFLSPSASCASNTIGANDVLVASQATVSSQSGPVTLSFNTAQLLAATGQPRFANGQYCIKSRLTTANGSAIATNTIPLTLNNLSSYTAVLTFTSRTGGPTSAVSDINGLSYNQGDLSVKITPINFSSSSPVALISGTFQRNGVIGTTPVSDVINFTNVPVTGGSATITLSDTVGGVINNYTSVPAGTSISITSATDAAGNSVFTGTAATGIRIDNEAPPQTGTYVITANNGYIAGLYAFSSGVGGTTADSVPGVPGVGGVTVTYYAGPTTADAFKAGAAACDLTGLTAATTGASLNNTITTTDLASKVVVKDKLGNQKCFNVTVNTLAGATNTFGVDKITPTIAFTSASAGANSGSNVQKLFALTQTDTISGFNPDSQLRVTVVKNFTLANAGCEIGDSLSTAGQCKPVGSRDTVLVPLTVGYHTLTAYSIDQAGNVSGTVTRTVAYDNVAPSIGSLTQNPNPAAPLTSVTVKATATDAFDLASEAGRLAYGSLNFSRVTVSCGTTFDPTLVTSCTQDIALQASNLYRGLQLTDGSNNILGSSVGPSAWIQTTDVGGNSVNTGNVALTMTVAPVNILIPSSGTNTFALTSSVGATPSSTAATTNLTVTVKGSSTDPAFTNQPFATISLYKVNSSGELALVSSSQALAGVNDVSGVKTYTWSLPGVALTAGTSSATSVNTFYVIGSDAAGNGVVAQPVSITNPIVP